MTPLFFAPFYSIRGAALYRFPIMQISTFQVGTKAGYYLLCSPIFYQEMAS